MGEISAENLRSAIEASKSQPLSRVLVGLGIRHLGPIGASQVARRLGSLGAVRSASVEELSAVDQIGPIIAESIVAFMANPTNAVVLDRLVSRGLALVEPDAGLALDGGPLDGKVIVVTGAIEGMTRLEVEAAVEAAGGKATGSVSKKTYCVVLGEAPGASKVAKAESLGIPMLPAASFDELLATGALPVT